MRRRSQQREYRKLVDRRDAFGERENRVRMTLMFATPIFAKIAVTAAKIADSKAQKSQDADQVFRLAHFREPRAHLPDGE